MDEMYRKRAGALADKYQLARLPVAPKEVGDDLYPDPTTDAYTETVLCAFVRVESLSTDISRDAVTSKLAADELTAIEALPDTRVDDPKEYMLRVTDTADTDPLVGYYEASDLDIGTVVGHHLHEPWGVFHVDEGFFDGRFTSVLEKLWLFEEDGRNRIDAVKEFRGDLLDSESKSD